jgi:type VI secretion system protein ImpK
MREPLAGLVTDIIRTALRTADDFRHGGNLPFEAARELLIEKFRELGSQFQFGVVSGLRVNSMGEFDLLATANSGRQSAENYLGVGYALACWVDELFTLNSPVAAQWNERKFEVEFFSTNERAFRFWQQARLAADRTQDDDLEVYYLCVVLGFRGEWIEQPAELKAWLGSTRERLLKGLRQDWAGPSALSAPMRVPLRYGKVRLRQMALIAVLATLVLIPVAALLIARQLI